MKGIEETTVRPTPVEAPKENGAYWVREATIMVNSYKSATWILHKWVLVWVVDGLIEAGLTWHDISPIPFDGPANVFFAISEKVNPPA